MAVGIKGNTGGGGSGRGRSYGLMLILAFGAAVLGVMVIHKLRDRRIFNLLVKEKDRQLISLQLLLQKERESTKEERRKIEELKAKILYLKKPEYGASQQGHGDAVYDCFPKG
ncbi:hypothetical protein CK203_081740 [Vitis vinifera]|uniref:Uncharacterized protein n=1 Tax=Vitis vinifera TaxID=29760 RepID=A0A438EFA6_VITVI|nr:hypothetical protein CK203_081740 [Vitis vinifera]